MQKQNCTAVVDGAGYFRNMSNKSPETFAPTSRCSIVCEDVEASGCSFELDIGQHGCHGGQAIFEMVWPLLLTPSYLGCKVPICRNSSAGQQALACPSVCNACVHGEREALSCLKSWFAVRIALKILACANRVRAILRR